MILGRIAGEIHSTINHPFYDAKKLLVVEKTDPEGLPTGDYLIAVDVVDAGVGERVLVLDEGNGARQVLSSSDGPVRSVVVGIIDHVERLRQPG
ncbi:MAG: EutN/CcmL family microcompartment protein [Acidobacteriia bacterium]|nr:EutN/CcmL family microcompartment protein [Terriglobia bacterium]